MAMFPDLVATLWFLAGTGLRFRRALETPRMLKAGATPGLAYYGMVSLWMDLAGVNLSELWERRAFELFGLLSEYCMQIDRFADTVSGGQHYLDDPHLWKRHPRFTPFVQALADRLQNDPSLSRATRRELLHVLQTYRYAANASLRDALQVGALADLQFVLRHKETTSSAAFSTCVDLLSIVHAVEQPRRAALQAVFIDWGMCLQVTDDLTDLAQDYGKVQNIVASILLSHPQELAALAAVEMKSGQIPMLAPETYAEVRAIFDRHLRRVASEALGGRSLKQMQAVARGLFWLGTTQFSPRVFRGYVKGILRLLGSHKWRPIAAGSLPARDA